MKVPRIIPGVNNNQRFRVILNGVGFYTTVKDMTDMPFTDQRVAIWTTMERLVNEMPKIRGLSTTHRVYDSKMQPKEFQVQIDLA